ncbi:MAG: type 1 glutamine amidotransferase domain-containing protein [Anaerolineales bacterium]
MNLQGMRVAVMVEEGFEDLELWVVVMRLREEGAGVSLLGAEVGRRLRGKSGGLTASADLAGSEVHSADFEALVIPGGWAPDRLRRYQWAKSLVGQMHREGKVIGMICHAGLVGISAGIVAGRKATGSLGIKDDLVNAGATWVDQPAFQDGNLVWGRIVDDIPDFCRELIQALITQKARAVPAAAE